MMQFSDLPFEVKCKIFVYIEPNEFVEVCSVSKDWNRAVNDSMVWIERLKKNNIYCKPDVLHFILFDRKEMVSFYSLQRKSNLLKNVNLAGKLRDNPTREENFAPKFDDWQDYSGDWKIERHVGCNDWPLEAGSVNYNAVTSHMRCKRCQEIDLSKWYPNIVSLLSNGFKIRVYWHVWVAARYDCHSYYEAKLRFSGPNGDEYIDLASAELAAGREWKKLTATCDLEMKKSTLLYFDYGIDRKYWAGHYGAKILNPTITVRIVK